MNPIIKLATTALGLAALVVSAGVFNPGSASAAGTTIECTTPDLVYCTISNPDGISQVIATNHTDFGDIELVNVVSPSCPTSVDVILGGDTVLSAGPITFDVTPCSNLGLKGSGNGGGRSDLGFKAPQGGGHQTFGLGAESPERALGVQLGIMFGR